MSLLSALVSCVRIRACKTLKDNTIKEDSATNQRCCVRTQGLMMMEKKFVVVHGKDESTRARQPVRK